jgi:hypothetical protein
VTPASELRASGPYALVDGRWLSSGAPGPGRKVLVREVSDDGPSPGFAATPTAGVYMCEFDPAEVDELIKVTTTCMYEGVGPFEVRAVDTSGAGLVSLLYRGTDGGAAAALKGFRVGDQYSGRVVEGVVAVSSITDVSEKVTELPLFL